MWANLVGTCAAGFYDAGLFGPRAEALHCMPCPPGGQCSGGALATVFAGKDQWIDEARQGANPTRQRRHSAACLSVSVSLRSGDP
jgi:hypothetical protein